MNPFGRPCPRKSCKAKIVRATGDLDSNEVEVRCSKGHRAIATQHGNGVRLKGAKA